MKKILGLSAFIHDSAAALIIDGQIVAAAEEERFVRQKHTRRFPKEAIAYCLNEAGIAPHELDVIAFYLDISPNPWKGLKRGLEISSLWANTHRSSIKHAISCALTTPQAFFRNIRSAAGSLFPAVNWGYHVRRQLGLKGGCSTTLIGVPHHLAHISDAYYLSGFEDSAILIADQRGEWITTSLAVAKNTKIDLLKQIALPDSLGSLYGVITTFLGFRALSGEGKVMGLSAYGKPQYYEAFRHLLPSTADGLFKLDASRIDFSLSAWTSYFPRDLTQMLGPPRNADAAIEERHMDIARSLQARLEDVLLSCCEYLKSRTDSQRLCLGGGIGLNSAANGRIARESHWSQVYVPPAPGDAGAALGAANWISAQSQGALQPSSTGPYLGPAYDEANCQRALALAGLNFRRLRDVANTAANLLSKGYILGWFQSRMEFGPRALGNRSILADPRTVGMRDRVNKLKGREPWRPLAPSFLAYSVPEWVEGAGESPFMSFVMKIRADKAPLMPACVHVDGTSRIQTVRYEDNPKYYQLIKSFERLTGIPCVLNTSFNRRGEPIVCTPQDAVRSFIEMDLDYLVLGDLVATKRLKNLDKLL